MRFRRLAVLFLALSMFAALGGGVASASDHADGCIVSYDGHKEWYDSHKEWYDSDKEWYRGTIVSYAGHIEYDLCYGDYAPTTSYSISSLFGRAR